jgi:hypothetical protein
MADEQDRLRRLRALEAEQAAAGAASIISPDAQDIRSEATKLTPAQVAAQQALKEASEAATALGIQNVIAPTLGGTVGQISKAPTTPPKEGYEWASRSTSGGGIEWYERPISGYWLGRGGRGGGGGGDGGGGGGTKTVVSTYIDPTTGDVIAVYSDGTTAVLSKGTKEADAAEEKRRQGQSAYDLLFSEFERYGLGALVEPLKGFITEGLSPAEFTLRLRETDAYKKRFAANQARIQKGLRALSEAEYIGLEDQYQDVMRRYGLPETYYTRGDMGIQQGFEKFIGGDVSPVELEDRIQTAQRRVINAAPEVTASLRSFYPEIGQGDLLAYFLDPDKAIENIKRKVTAAEIGGAATMAGLTTGMARAEELGRYGVTGEAARQGFQTIAEVLPRGSQLAEIYKQSPYTQTTAEQEVFGLTGATEASKRRRQLTQLEQATFSGQAGAAGGALGRERAGAF